MRNGKYTLIVAPEGYPGKLYRGRYAYEHIVNFWIHNNRMPKDGHQIHHVNHDTRDNCITNLEEIDKYEHMLLHAYLRKVEYIPAICYECKIDFSIAPNQFRSRTKKGQTTFCCSRSCQVRRQQRELKAARNKLKCCA